MLLHYVFVVYAINAHSILSVDIIPMFCRVHTDYRSKRLYIYLFLLLVFFLKTHQCSHFFYLFSTSYLRAVGWLIYFFKFFVIYFLVFHVGFNRGVVIFNSVLNSIEINSFFVQIWQNDQFLNLFKMSISNDIAESMVLVGI